MLSTIDFEVNYHVLEVMLLKEKKWGSPNCSRIQPAPGNGVRDGRSNEWPFPHTLHRAVLPELHVLHGANTGHKSQNLLQPLGHEHARIRVHNTTLHGCHAKII